tara:strand:+ start:620 stop:2026 length:1407 start_codon:yes stop_codon:yes gene_type:complete
MQMKKSFRLREVFLILSIFTLTSNLSVASNLPNFTSIVDDNIDAVVIVNAKKNIDNNTSLQPNIPEQFKPFFDRFFENNPIPNEQYRQTPSFGSGFIISSDGYIMTNNHVVAGADEITITLNDESIHNAKLIGSDKRSDLALLKINMDNLPVVKIGNSSDLKLGEWVLAIGSPFGFDRTVTAGIVSGKKRNLPNENYVPYIQTDVAINPGNSGGPLFNLDGEVVGVNAQIYTRSGGFMGVSFAIPSETLRDVYNQLKNSGRVKRGWLGIFIQQVDKELAESFGLDRPKGALVARILDDSPASKADIRQGDVILKFANQNINKSKDLPLLVGTTEVNSVIKIELMRNNKIITKFITIEELPEDKAIAKMQESTVDFTTVSGITVKDIDDSIKKSLNILGGVRVENISSLQRNSSKIRINDVITKINGTSVLNTKNFKSIVSSLKTNSTANILVYRDTSPIFLAIKILKD